MFNAISAKTQSYRPYLLFAISTLATLLVMTVDAQAANIDTTMANSVVIDCDAISSNNDSSLKSILYQRATSTTFDCKLAELKRFQDRPSLSNLSVDQIKNQQYWIYKAQAWLNYATYEHSMDSHTDAGKHALQSADIIIQALTNSTEQHINLNPDIPIGSALMRPDLWALLKALKDTGGISEAPKELAFSEVALVQAAADHCAHGEKQSGSYFRMADRWLELAREAYVNAHDSKTNVALEQLTNSYYKQYALLDSSDDSCRGHVFKLMPQQSMIPLAIHAAKSADDTISNTKTLTISIKRRIYPAQVTTIHESN